jgi:hypothetical protein
MNKAAFYIVTAAFLCASSVQPMSVSAQAGQATSQTAGNARGNSQASVLNLTPYGITIQPDKRLIVMMAALDAAGFDPTPAGSSPSVFRQQIRKDLATLDPDLRQRMHDFFEHNRLKASADFKPTPADDAARYVSLALTLGETPQLDSPARSEELPSEILEVLDFAPLVREFYRRSGMNERLPGYYKQYQAEGDNMRRPVQAMVHDVLSYLHTQPITTRMERIVTTAPSTGKKKPGQKKYTMREHPRTFFVIPDLLAVPGSINFRGIADDYFVIVPFQGNAASSEIRRAYLQYVIDPLVVRFSKEISERRDQLKIVLASRTKEGGSVSPDVFLAVSRSLVAATDARMEELEKLKVIDAASSSDLRAAAKAKDPAAERAQIVKRQEGLKRAAADEKIAQLADAYERGSVLSFFFADQLNGVETSGFDIASSIPDMVASFDPAKESVRLTEVSEARKRALVARKERIEAAAKASVNAADAGPGSDRRKGLVQGLAQVEDLLRVKNYTEAEARLKALMLEYQQEPRIFFALGQAASVSAQDAFDEGVQGERLERALFNYRSSIQWASPDYDKALISRAHAAIGRILAFMDKPQDAIKEFDAVIAMGEQADKGALNDALAGKRALAQPK